MRICTSADRRGVAPSDYTLNQLMTILYRFRSNTVVIISMSKKEAAGRFRFIRLSFRVLRRELQVHERAELTGNVQMHLRVLPHRHECLLQLRHDRRVAEV